MTRKLASIQRITRLSPINGADKIETARVLGWDVVVGKGDFSEGDLAVFFEIDSFLPASDPRYASFEDRFTTLDGERGMRVKTIRLRKQLSQGLLMPVSKFPQLSKSALSEDADVTEVLGIKKWELVEAAKSSNNVGKTTVFPSFIRKTDQERIQNISNKVFEALDKNFQVSIKKDGSSMTAYVVQPNSPHYAEAKRIRDGKDKRTLFKKALAWVSKNIFGKYDPDLPIVGICSRNVALPLDGDSNFHKVFKKYNMYEYLYNFGSDVAIQGELVSPDIQGNYEKVDTQEFHMFNLFSIEDNKYFLPSTAVGVAIQSGIKHVTLLHSAITLRKLIGEDNCKTPEDVCAAILKLAEGPSDNKGVMREGLVFKSVDCSLSFKAISNSYLLKTGK